MRIIFSLLIYSSLATSAFGQGRVSVLMGPPSMGQGGSNPLSLPPSALDFHASYVTSEQSEFTLSVVPGAFYGKRWLGEHGLRAGFGAGVLLSLFGIGPALYQSVGWESPRLWDKLRLDAEFRQLVGVTEIGLEFPYVLRMGLSYEI